jgi:hypothetical protein
MRPKRLATGEPGAVSLACEPPPRPEGPDCYSQGAVSHCRRTDMAFVSRKPEPHTPVRGAPPANRPNASNPADTGSTPRRMRCTVRNGPRVSQQAETPSSRGLRIRFREPRARHGKPRVLCSHRTPRRCSEEHWVVAQPAENPADRQAGNSVLVRRTVLVIQWIRVSCSGFQA